MILLQYVPRLVRIIPLYLEITRSAGTVVDTAWPGAAFNLLVYILASHVSSLIIYQCCWNILTGCKSSDHLPMHWLLTGPWSSLVHSGHTARGHLLERSLQQPGRLWSGKSVLWEYCIWKQQYVLAGCVPNRWRWRRCGPNLRNLSASPAECFAVIRFLPKTVLLLLVGATKSMVHRPQPTHPHTTIKRIYNALGLVLMLCCHLY